MARREPGTRGEERSRAGRTGGVVVSLRHDRDMRVEKAASYSAGNPASVDSRFPQEPLARRLCVPIFRWVCPWCALWSVARNSGGTASQIGPRVARRSIRIERITKPRRTLGFDAAQHHTCYVAIRRHTCVVRSPAHRKPLRIKGSALCWRGEEDASISKCIFAGCNVRSSGTGIRGRFDAVRQPARDAR